MNRTTTLSRGVLLAAALVAGLLAAFYAVNASGAGTTRVVMTAKNKALGRTILVNLRGLSLYSLSVERRGKFICTNAACLSLWKPLLVPKGTKPTGVTGLGTIKRPTGKIQVTYRGRAALPVRERPQAWRHQGQRLQGRRHVAGCDRRKSADVDDLADDDRSAPDLHLPVNRAAPERPQVFGAVPALPRRMG